MVHRQSRARTTSYLEGPLPWRTVASALARACEHERNQQHGSCADASHYLDGMLPRHSWADSLRMYTAQCIDFRLLNALNSACGQRRRAVPSARSAEECAVGSLPLRPWPGLDTGGYSFSHVATEAGPRSLPPQRSSALGSCGKTPVVVHSLRLDHRRRKRRSGEWPNMRW